MKKILGCLLWLSCATAKPEMTAGAAKEKKGPELEKMVLKNVVSFDVASCFPKTPEVTLATNELVTSALMQIQPAMSECLVNPAHLTAAPFDAKITVTSNDVGSTAAVSGAVLSPEGKACLETALKNVKLGPAKKGAPVSTDYPLQPALAKVTMGVNAASDAIAELRLLQPAMCGCYGIFRTENPPEVSLDVATKEAGNEFKFLGPAEIGTCVEARLKTAKLSKPGLMFKAPFLLVNSYASAAPTTGPADIIFQAMDAQSLQRMSEVLTAGSQRGMAATEYDEVVKRYKSKPSGAILTELQKKCPLIGAADDTQLTALKGLFEKYNELATFTANEKIKNAQWAQAEARVNEKKTTIANEMERVEKQKKADAMACPKVR
jgi:hypothetical protein